MKKRYRTLLENAKEKIRSGWCQQFHAINEEGEEVDPKNEDASCFCALGALQAAGASQQEEMEIAWMLMKHLPKDARKQNLSVWKFNDQEGTTRLKILGLFTRALRDS